MRTQAATPSPSRPSQPISGPGTELKAIFRSVGIWPTRRCICNVRAAEMDRLGIQGCREHREEILAWLREAEAKASWLQRVVASAMAVATGLAFKVDPSDPAPGILDEAIRRAEAKEKERANAERR